ncbi:MAG: dienelactone hydrolase family protein [Chloroflexota bacterium]
MKNLITAITQLPIFKTRTDPALHHLTIDGHTMIYRDINVDKSEAATPLPILIGLHGHGIHEGQMETLVGLELDQPFIYISLRAFHTFSGGGYTWFPFDIQDGTIISEEAQVMQSLEWLAKFIPAVVEAKQADPHQVYIVGYSMGSGMSQSFMLTYPELIAGAVAMAGQYFPQIKPHIAEAARLKGKPLFIGHGVKDPFISEATMEGIVDEFTDLGVDVTYKTYQIPHVVSPTERKDVEAWFAERLFQ